MKKILPIFIFIAITLFFFSPFFLHRFLPIPSDTIIGLYHPFRDLYAKTNPNGIAYKNFLITDPVRQQYPWRSLAIAVEKNLQLPLWNPYNFAGVPLLGNFQSAAFYPLNIFLFLLPMQYGWSILIFLQPVLAGLFLYLYLRKIRCSSFASLLGAITFAFCGFSVAWMEWGTLGHTVLWLPLVLFIKEKLLEKFTFKWAVMLIFAESSAVFAGHLQVLFYALCISNLYLFARIAQLSFLSSRLHQNNKKRNFSEKTILFSKLFLQKYLPFFIVGMIMFAITAIQWLPTVQFIHLSARDIDQSQWQQAGWFIPWQNLAQFLAPDFFGNPATLNYWGIWNYAEFIGYVGIVPLILAFFAMFFRYDKKTLFFGSLFFMSLLFALPTPVAAIPFVLKIPLLSTSQPTRLLFVTDFSLAILAALGWDQFVKQKKKILFPVAVFGLLFIMLWIVALWAGVHVFGISPEDISTTKHNLVLPTVLFGISAILFLSFPLVGNLFKLVASRFKRSWTSQDDKREKHSLFFISCLILILVSFDLLRFAQKFTPFTPQQYLFPSTQALTFLQENSGIYRYMTTDSRIFPPNFSLMYHLQSVDGYDPLYLKNYAEFIAASERNTPNIQPPFGFNRIITPHNYDSQLMDLLGVKYVISLSDITSPKLKKVFQEGQTHVYENTHVFPRAFFVKHVLTASNNQEVMNMLFDKTIDLHTTAVVQNQQELINQTFAQGTINRFSYSENAIDLTVTTPDTGFLILTDTYYPTWHAMVDGKEEDIIRTDYLFRGVLVPKGEHVIHFSSSLF